MEQALRYHLQRELYTQTPKLSRRPYHATAGWADQPCCILRDVQDGQQSIPNSDCRADSLFASILSLADYHHRVVVMPVLGSKIVAPYHQGYCVSFTQSTGPAVRDHFRVMATSTKLAFLTRDSGNSSSPSSPSTVSFPGGATDSTISSTTPTVPVLNRTLQSS